MNLFFRVFGKSDKTPVYLPDVDSGGYSVYFMEHKFLVSQGKTKKEALENLNRDLEEVLSIKKMAEKKAAASHHRPQIAQ